MEAINCPSSNCRLKSAAGAATSGAILSHISLVNALMPERQYPVIPVSLKRILKTWWPLAASWLLMSLEGPSLSAVMARMADPEINLAAYGGVVYPLVLIIESPVVMLLAASTALSKDWNSYKRLREYMMISGALMTVVHILLAVTPAYYWYVGTVIGVPDEIVEPARIGLLLLCPWTWAIGYRRLQQGVLIRNGYSSAVGVGTVIRLLTDILLLAVGYLINLFPGIVVATIAQAAGVISEAVYSRLRVKTVLETRIKQEPPGEGLSWRDFAAFYIPLALTSLLSLVWQQIGSAALSRLPLVISSLAVWPVINGLIFMLRSFGFAYNEVVVALLGTHGSTRNLRKFTLYLTLSVTVLHVIIAATPLSRIWFEKVTALAPDLAELAETGLWLVLPLTVMSVLTSWYQGAIVYCKKTSAIPESYVVFLGLMSLLLVAGVLWIDLPGIFTGLTALSIGTIAQTVWLYIRSRAILRQLNQRDLETGSLKPQVEIN